jgi:hypothetical protein
MLFLGRVGMMEVEGVMDEKQNTCNTTRGRGIWRWRNLSIGLNLVAMRATC